MPNFIDSSMTNLVTNQQSPIYPSTSTPFNINNLLSKIRSSISQIESEGYKIQSSEIDMDNEYQIIIKIPKGN